MYVLVERQVFPLRLLIKQNTLTSKEQNLEPHPPIEAQITRFRFFVSADPELTYVTPA